MMEYSWSALYEKVDGISRLKDKKEIYCPIIIDNILHIVKANITLMEKDVKAPDKHSELNYRCYIDLYVKKKFFGIFHYNKKINVKLDSVYILGNSLIDCLIRTLTTYKKSNHFQTFFISGDLQKIIADENIYDKLITRYIGSNRFPNVLIFNKIKEDNESYNKYSKNVCIN